MTTDKLTVIVFSKNRACQLDALLRSLSKNLKIPHVVYVLYSYSNDQFKQGYDKLKFYHKTINFVLENAFESQLKSMINDVHTPYLCFMVDDMVLKRRLKFDGVLKAFQENLKVGCLSIRLGADINSDFKKTSLEKINESPSSRYILWNWKTCNTKGWNYPMSVDGNIFRTEDLKQYVQPLRFKLPNSFESAMAQTPISKQYMICYLRSKTVNLLMNRVQTEMRKNEGGILDEAYLNNEWLAGCRLHISVYDKTFKHNRRHVPTPFIITERDDRTP